MVRRRRIMVDRRDRRVGMSFRLIPCEPSIARPPRAAGTVGE